MPAFDRAKAKAKSSHKKVLEAHYEKYGSAYGAIPAGVTHDAQGREVQLTRQLSVTRTGHARSQDEWEARGSVPGDQYRYTYGGTYDKGWDAYNKALREMRHRVQYGIRSRREKEVSAKVGKFGPTQARAATLVATAFDE